jgi:hypothetical protein
MPLDQAIRCIEVLKWPLVVLICFRTSVAVFRRQLGELISRITSISKQGVKAGPSTHSQQSLRLHDAKLPSTPIVAVELRVQNRDDSTT